MARFSHPSIFKANKGLRDFEVMGDGICRPMPSPPKALLDRFPYREPYRLYRFLSDLDDLVEMVPHDLQRIGIAAKAPSGGNLRDTLHWG